MVLKLAFVLFSLVIKLCISTNDIIILDDSTFTSAKQEFDNLLVFFNDESCQQCKNAAQLYYTLTVLCDQQYHASDDHTASVYTIDSTVQFAQINYANNQQIFEKEGVETVPEFMLYIKGIQKPFRFTLIALTHENLWMMVSWIKRVTQKTLPSFQNINKLDQMKLPTQKYVVIDCKQVQLMTKIKESEDFFINLDINYICLNNSQLRNGNILLKQKDYILKFAQCMDGNQEQQKNWHQCQNAIKNFRFRGIIHWSDDMIDNLYNKNYSLVVAVTSNESASHNYIRELTKIKNQYQLKQKDRKQVLPIFTVADVFYDLQGTIRIKKFIGGYSLIGWPYPYPLLAYLWCNQKGEIIKYIYQQRYQKSPPSSLSISQWIQKARVHNLTRHYQSLNLQTEIQQLINKERKTLYKVYLNEVLAIRDKYKNPDLLEKKPIMFLYIIWRGSWEMQLIGSRLKRWWGGVKYDTFFFWYDLFENDIPAGMTIDQLPAFVIYYSDGTFSVSEGIKSEEQIKAIIAEVYKGTIPPK